MTRQQLNGYLARGTQGGRGNYREEVERGWKVSVLEIPVFQTELLAP